MATTVATNGLYYAKLFGVSEDLIDACENANVIMYYEAGYMYAVCNGVTESMPLKASSITLAKNDSLGSASKSMISHSLTLMLSKFKLGKPAVAFTPKYKATFKNHISSPNVPPLVSTSSDGPADYPEGDVFKLSLATKIGQKVKGTNSTYRVAVRMQGINIACRKSLSKFSVRVEGQDLNYVSEDLKKLGMKDGGDYFSIHLVVDDPLDCDRIIGAVAATCNLNKIIEIASISSIGTF